MIQGALIKSHVLTSYDPASNRTYYTTYDWRGINVGSSYWYKPPNGFSFSPPNTDGIIGATDLSLAEKYNIPYVKMIGGNNIEIYQPYEFPTIPDSQAYKDAVTAAIAAAESQGALQLAQQELAAKTAYLGSNTATWVSGIAYKAEVAETTAEIRAFNADVAAFLATAPVGNVTQAQQAGVSIQSKPAAQTAQIVQPGGQTTQQASASTPTGEKKDNTATILISAGAAVVALAVLYFIGGKK